MSQLTCIVKVESKPEHGSQVKSELIKLIQPTLQEPGCIQYNMYTDNECENTFMFHENWQSELDLKKHLESQHVADCFAVIGDMVTSVDIKKVTPVNA